MRRHHRLGRAPVPPEGKPRLLVVSNRSGSANIYLVNVDGTGAKNLTDHKSENSYPMWSPDGKRIAFASDRDGTTHIYVMDADGRQPQATDQGEGARPGADLVARR